MAGMLACLLAAFCLLYIYKIKIINTSNNTRILLISNSTNFNQPLNSGNLYNRRHKMLFQLSCGQLGFKGATRKSSFVISKLIQLLKTYKERSFRKYTQF